MNEKFLLNFSLEQIVNRFTQMGIPAFRARQVYGWLLKGHCFEEMSNIPKDLRSQLSNTFICSLPKVYRKFVSQSL